MTWREDDGAAHDFLIVHKDIDKPNCDPGAKSGWVSSIELAYYLGPDGFAALMAMLSAGPILEPKGGRSRVKDYDQFVDVVRRLQVPWYEEARQHFRSPEVTEQFRGGSEITPYLPDMLELIATRSIG